VRAIDYIISTVALLANTACAKGAESSADTVKTAGDVIAATDSAKPAADTGMKGDADKSVGGTGVPAGYMGATDRSSSKLSEAKYTVAGGKWEVQTGPAHIVWAAKDAASGIYGATATFEQLEKPTHPEAYGLIFGGQHLDDPAQRKYAYFLVRGTGEYLIKVRDGEKTTSVAEWTASPNVPKGDASGKATYQLLVHVARDTVHYTVNGKLVAATPKSVVPTDGIAGLRINHNLHVRVTPVAISK
jgi:hypothetical protein